MAVGRPSLHQGTGKRDWEAHKAEVSKDFVIDQARSSTDLPNEDGVGTRMSGVLCESELHEFEDTVNTMSVAGKLRDLISYPDFEVAFSRVVERRSTPSRTSYPFSDFKVELHEFEAEAEDDHGEKLKMISPVVPHHLRSVTLTSRSVFFEVEADKDWT